MSNVTVKRTLNVPVIAAWEALADFGGIYKFNPNVEQSRLLGTSNQGIGATRRCDFYNGRYVNEEVTGWHAGKSMEIAITGGDMPLKTALATVSLAADAAGGTEVTFHMDYTVAMGPLGTVMDVLMMRRQFRKMLGQLLEGLELHVTTGEVIGRDLKPLAA